MSSLVNIGQTTSAALSNVLNFNWPSVLVIGVGVLLATVLVPYLVKWIANSLVIKENVYAQNYPFYKEYSAPHEHYSRNFEGVLKCIRFISIMADIGIPKLYQEILVPV